MTTHYLHHGGAGPQNPYQELYPAAPPRPMERLAPAAHKEPIAFGNTRLLDFSQLDGRRQAGLQQYLERATAEGHPLQAGDQITMAVIPALSLLLGYAWGVEEPEAGVAFDLELYRDGVTLEGGITGGAIGSNGVLLPQPQWFVDSDWLAVRFTSFPANGASDLRLWVTPIVLAPKLGN